MTTQPPEAGLMPSIEELIAAYRKIQISGSMDSALESQSRALFSKEHGTTSMMDIALIRFGMAYQSLTAKAQDDIWIVQGSTGEYSDHYEWIVCAVYNEDAAKKIVEELSAMGRDCYDIRQKGNYRWHETESGKSLIERDPNASIDYTGINYTAFNVKITPSGEEA